MDYLNYGKHVQQPQKPQPQGFGQQKVQLTEDDFTFGDLTQQTTQPQTAPPKNNFKFGDLTQQTQVEPQPKKNKDELMQMFPIPLLISSCPFEYNKELEWIKKQPFRTKENNLEQSPNNQSEDTFILDKLEMVRVRQFIEFKLKQFVVKIMGFDSEIIITQSWLNKNGKGESHPEHKHPNSIVSGVWYPQIHDKLPPIKFADDRHREVAPSIDKLNNFNCATYMLPLRKGELILFPSNIKHSVPVNQFDEERISLSFNTWCKGDMGDIEALTYLPIDRCV